MLTTSIAELLASHEFEPYELFLLRRQAEELARRRPTGEIDGMESLQSSRETLLYPHQVHAAHFAVSNPLLPGMLLADEVGLGKTIEAAMIIKELIYRGAGNILVVTPKSLCAQWAEELRTRFSLDFQVIDGPTANRMERKGEDPWRGLRICTYHFVNSRIAEICTRPWDALVVDECHKLKNPAGALHESIDRVPRRLTILLTATPIQNYLPELHSICSLIDPEALGTEFSFRENFCEDGYGLVVKNLNELKDRLSRFAVRTLRSDVPEIKFTARIARLFNFQLNDDERDLYTKVSSYLSRPTWAFGANAAGKYLIILIYRKLLASSSFALLGALGKLQKRLEAMVEGKAEPALTPDELEEADAEPAELGDLEWDREADQAEEVPVSLVEELEEVRGYVQQCEKITENAKGQCLVEAMPELKKTGERILIFTQYKKTMRYLTRILRAAGYEVVQFHGDLQSHPNPEKDEREHAKQIFRESADVMIATDAGAEGLNLQFCHVVVNYDLPWNPMKIEQRIGRAHRIGQEHDVVVANLVAMDNAVDRRLVELLTDKIHLFNTVLGETDEILGIIEDGMDFERRIFEIAQSCRTPDEIGTAFQQLQLDLDEVIVERRTTGRTLLQGFDDRIRDHLRIAEQNARSAVDKRARQLEGFLRASLDHFGAEYLATDGLYTIHTPAQYVLESDKVLDDVYHGTFDKRHPGDAPLLNKQHPLLDAAIQNHLHHGHQAALQLAYTGRHNIHGIERLVGHDGWWLVFRVSFAGFETEDHLLEVALVRRDGELSVDDLLTANITRITTQPMRPSQDFQCPSADDVQEWLRSQIEALEERILERNAEYYVKRREVIGNYYGARGDGEALAEVRHHVEELTRQIAESETSIAAADSMTAKADIMTQKDRLDERLFQLQQRMQTEQMENFKAKREELRKLEALRSLDSEVELIAAAQWQLA